MGRIYPTLVSGKFAATVNFYEDHFGLTAVVEEDGYALLQAEDDASCRIAVFDVTHPCVAERTESVKGLILSLHVDNVSSVYENLYMEGVDICKELGTDVLGNENFIVYDPNGVLVSVTAATYQEASAAAA